jgi:hypothetical protein
MALDGVPLWIWLIIRVGVVDIPMQLQYFINNTSSGRTQGGKIGRIHVVVWAR